MARPLRIQFPGAFYHVTCRGNNRRRIFLDINDRHHFTKYLVESLKMYFVVLHGYALMDNHFHLLVETLRPNLKEFMRRFNICYTGWFNWHHQTYGHLYQGRYKALLIDVDNYLLEVSRYVHLNPVHRGDIQIVSVKERWEYLKQYSWSSLPGFVNTRYISKFINYDKVLSMIGGRSAYRDFILDGMQNGTDNIHDNIIGQTIIGDKLFIDKIQEKYPNMEFDKEQPDFLNLANDLPDPNMVLERASAILKLNNGINSYLSKRSIERCMVAELLFRFCDLSQKNIGLLLGGVGYSAVSMMRQRLRKTMENNTVVKEKYEEAERELLRQIED